MPNTARNVHHAIDNNATAVLLVAFPAPGLNILSLFPPARSDGPRFQSKLFAFFMLIHNPRGQCRGKIQKSDIVMVQMPLFLQALLIILKCYCRFLKQGSFVYS